MTQYNQIIDDIVRLNSHISEFWSTADGWAPVNASQLLDKSCLDNQDSLSRTLRLWLEPCEEGESKGRRILAWTNLGALVECTLKWFLCVYEANYSESPLTKKHGSHAGQPLEPDEHRFVELIEYYQKHVWTESQRDEWNSWMHEVRRKRNAIHAFHDFDLGTWEQFYAAVERYRDLILELDGRVPYPEPAMCY